MRLIFLGPPGAGKKTQAAILADLLQIPHISPGDILRQAVVQETFLGLRAQAFLEKGELVPDTLVIELIRERLSQSDVQRGWILDGFPRNVSQAQALEQLLQDMSQPYDWAINFEVSIDVLLKRMLGLARQNNHSMKSSRCLDIAQKQTAPLTLIEFYQHRHFLKTIDGNLPVAAVTYTLQDLLQLKAAV